MKSFPILILSAAVLGLVACGEKAGPKKPAAAPVTSMSATNPPFYLVRGVVKKVDAADKTVSIQHEEIPNYMPSMTMPFKVKDVKELEGLEPNDTIWFVLQVTDTESWIEKVRKQTNAPPVEPQATAPPERESFRIARDVEPLNVGDKMPNYQFTNELGRTVQLSDFRGKALAFTFIFTRCPLPDFCPRMSQNFAAAYKQLNAMPNAPTNWHLMSISFDPHHDTPTVLRNYAQLYQYDPKRWSFVTGAMIDIDAITDQFNLAIMKRDNDWDHKIRTVVVDATGRIQSIIIGNEWKPAALVEEIVKAARATEASASAGPG